MYMFPYVILIQLTYKLDKYADTAIYYIGICRGTTLSVLKLTI